MPIRLLTRLRPWLRIHCPYCLRSFALRRMHLRCDKACQVTHQYHCPDPILTRALHGPVASADPSAALLNTWWTDPLTNGRGGFRGLLDRMIVPASLKCAVCRGQAEDRLCPYCHASIPDAILSDRPAQVAVLGSQSVGKSTWISVAIEELERSVGPREGFVLDPLDEPTRRRYRDEYRPRVYGTEERSLADAFDPAYLAYGHQATRPLAEDPGVIRPLVFRIVPQDARARPSVLSIFDCAGEDWENRDETFRSEADYLARARGLLLLIDPLRIEALATDPKLRLGRRELAARPADYADDIRHLAALLEERGAKRPTRVPLAIGLTKLDRWASLLPEGTTLRELAMGVPGVLETSPGLDAAIHEEVRAALGRWAGDAFLRQVDLKFPDHRCFALSSLGDAAGPEDGRPLALPIPWLVERPILWLLRRQGVLRAGIEKVRG